MSSAAVAPATAAVVAAAAAPASAEAPLKCILFIGSARQDQLPWNPNDTGRLGDRVVAFTQSRLAARAAAGKVELDVEVWDPAAIPLFQKVMQSPMYFKKSPSEDEKAYCAKVEAADCYLVVSPEYNHSIPSPLVNMMNIFGGSKYANTVSGCVCYSSTPIGGPRVAYALRPYLSELGCVPVSKQVIVTDAFKRLTAEGVPTEGNEKHMLDQMDKMLDQVAFWASALRAKKAQAE